MYTVNIIQMYSFVLITKYCVHAAAAGCTITEAIDAAIRRLSPLHSILQRQGIRSSETIVNNLCIYFSRVEWSAPELFQT